jgi:glycosyltransferase involved in cell wall biosynthesis
MDIILKFREILKPTVAVIIPYFNGAKWIERAIQSVVTQTIPPDEFIIVNDGSQPAQREGMGKLAKKYPFKIIDKENGGQGSARNAGVAATTADYISFLDQDDFYLPNHIEDLVNALPEYDDRLGFVYADLCIADGDGNVRHSRFVKDRGPHPKHAVADLLSQDMYMVPSATLISRQAFEAVNGFDEQFVGYEDDDLFMRILLAGYSNHWLDKSVTVWCINAESTSYSILMSRSRFKYFKKLLQSFPDNPEHGQFFFRDCIAPRFGAAILADAVKATVNQSKEKVELTQFLSKYTKILRANKFTRLSLKLKFMLYVFVLTYSPPWVIRVMHYATFRLFVGQRL